MKITSLSTVFLCYNEEENVRRCIEEAVATMRRLGLPEWEVVVVDDGSTDRTAAFAMEYSREIGESRIRVARHSCNRGYGEAMRTGFAEARCQWVFMTDGDLQFHLDDLDLLIEATSATRFVQGFRVGRVDPLGRIVLGAVYRGLVRAAFRLPVRDPECAFRLVHRDVLQAVPLRCRSDLVPVELIHGAKKRGFSVGEIGVRHRARAAGDSKAVSLAVFRKLALEALSFYVR